MPVERESLRRVSLDLRVLSPSCRETAAASIAAEKSRLPVWEGGFAVRLRYFSFTSS